LGFEKSMIKLLLQFAAFLWVTTSVQPASSGVSGGVPVKRVWNKHHLENDTFQQISLKFPKRLPEDKITLESKECDAAKAKTFAEQFYHELVRDHSYCPKEDWLTAMASADPDSNKLMMNIGMNKGYNLAVWANVFQPHLQITPRLWYEHLLTVKPVPEQTCGICDDCNQTFASSPISSSNYPLLKSNAKLTLIGADLNCANVEGVEKVFLDISSKRNTSSVSLFTACAGLSNASSSVIITQCPFGYEQCGINVTYEGETLSTKQVEVPITTVDELMKSFLTKILRESQPRKTASDLYSKENNNFRTRSIKRYFQISQTKPYPYHPLIDILLIDTEGNDYLVIKGAQKLIQARSIRVIVFEYHFKLPWGEMKLENAVKEMDEFGYECYFQGFGRLWKLTGRNCWHATYEFHKWSNVMCVRREDIWFETLQPFVVKELVGKPK
jgi:hypothetical protein